ncbi:MAG TPA: S9 family peptidase [Gemmatimonadaceae bacterium]|nr:S9 family peptidase [Gemmatimonadaceae bacterium]
MIRRVTSAALFAALAIAPLAAQQIGSGGGELTVQRIFRSSELRGAPPPSPVWLPDGIAYLELRQNARGSTEIVRVDVRSGAVTTVAGAQQLVGDDGKPIDVEDIQVSDDESRILVYHNSVRVWRRNTRGVYHVFDVRSGKMIPVSRAPGLQMFAKFSPDGKRVAFVRDNNLFVTDLDSGQETQLTRDGSETIINGTTDWVYEEELGLADAFRWSPDSKRLAFWRFDQSPVATFPLVNELSTYPKVETLRYPKAGEPNSRVQVGIIDVPSTPIGSATGSAGYRGDVTWLDVGKGNDQYLARMDWVDNDSLVVQRLPRKQNSVDVLMVSAATGKPRLMMTERDTAYVDVENGELRWVNASRNFLWLSDRSGWRQLYLIDRHGKVTRQLSSNGTDVLSVVGVDEKGGWVYYTAAAPTPMERNVYRARIGGGAPSERVTQNGGTHTMIVAPLGRFAIDSYSDLNTPATSTMYELPAMKQLRVMSDNAPLKARLAELRIKPAQFFKVPMPDGTQLDAWRIVPPDFDSTGAKKYPVLMYVYGGPASPTVSDAYGGSRYLWHQLLAQRGYIVVSIDNRGAAWRGSDFRKVTQYRLGMQESQDQIDAAKWLGSRPYVDARRIGMWGWSFGGYLTLMSTTRGGDVFKAGLSVAPVSDWKLYDTIYTERFMWTPQENAEGYRVTSPQLYAGGLTARLLMVHGTGDDNVHPQNSIQMADKLEGAGKVFYQVLYPNRTHAISERGVTPQVYETFTRFILDNL